MELFPQWELIWASRVQSAPPRLDERGETAKLLVKNEGAPWISFRRQESTCRTPEMVDEKSSLMMEE